MAEGEQWQVLKMLAGEGEGGLRSLKQKNKLMIDIIKL
jgi:hypothetical protein